MAKGTYCLCISIKDHIQIHIGALGEIKFPLGRYIYVGSALNGLKSRLQRHLNTSHGYYNAIHWHIDYLLKENEVTIESIYIRKSENKIECSIADGISDRGISVKGFGCSDCKCISHLFNVDDFKLLSELGMKKVSLSEYSKQR